MDISDEEWDRRIGELRAADSLVETTKGSVLKTGLEIGVSAIVGITIGTPLYLLGGLVENAFAHPGTWATVCGAFVALWYRGLKCEYGTKPQ